MRGEATIEELISRSINGYRRMLSPSMTISRIIELFERDRVTINGGLLRQTFIRFERIDAVERGTRIDGRSRSDGKIAFARATAPLLSPLLFPLERPTSPSPRWNEIKKAKRWRAKQKAKKKLLRSVLEIRASNLSRCWQNRLASYLTFQKHPSFFIVRFVHHVGRRRKWRRNFFLKKMLDRILEARSIVK